MSTTIAAAQIISKDEDINENLNTHYSLIRLAANKGVNLIAFPEMSITGYVRESGKNLSFTANDPRLDKLRELAVENNMIIIAGAPIDMNSELYIGSFLLYPNNTVSIYTKQFLHSGEDDFYSSSFDYNPVIHLDNERISLAICADISNPSHAQNAYMVNSTLYIASIFFTPSGISEAYNSLSNDARKYSMNVLMSNYCGKSWGLESGGKSGFWTKSGDLIAGAGNKSSGLLIVEKRNDIWNGSFIKI